ncbi:MAG: spinster family MFS transporter [Steroidobacteraceae bacterium]
MPARRGTRYGVYATMVLMLAYAFSYLDRQILTLMVGPIEKSLHINDAQFALLTGGAFGIFYTVMGLPLGWIADRFNRKWIVTIGIACWSIMTASCGLARSFGQLMLTRIGVGVGEATLSPSAYSMLADYFDRPRLPRAMSIYTCGIFIGAGLATILGGAVVSAVEHTPVVGLAAFGITHSWQVIFVVVGLPGLLMSVWLSTLREPPRRDPDGALTTAAPGSRDISGGLRQLRHFLTRYPWMSVALFMGSALFSILGTADTWYPELFIRTWGWSAAHSGWVNGTASLTAGPVGLLFAGWYSSRLIAAGRVDACLRLTALGALGITVPAIAMPLSPNPVLMSVLLLPLKFFVGFPPVLIPAAIGLVAPNRLRAQLGALFLFTTGVIGTSSGPLLPALFTDYVFKNPDFLRYSLALSTGLVGPIAFIILWLGLREYRKCFHDVALQPHTEYPADALNSRAT